MNSGIREERSVLSRKFPQAVCNSAYVVMAIYQHSPRLMPLICAADTPYLSARRTFRSAEERIAITSERVSLALALFSPYIGRGFSRPLAHASLPFCDGVPT